MINFKFVIFNARIEKNYIFSALPDRDIHSNRLLRDQFLLPAASDRSFLIFQVGLSCNIIF